MLRIGVLFFVLAAVVAGAGAAARPSPPARVVHSCSVTDQQFLDTYTIQLTEVGMYGDDFAHGHGKARDVIDAANAASYAMRLTQPADPSLRTIRKYAPAMFQAYAEAVRVRAAGKPARKAMLAAYGIGARIQDVLQAARPALTRLGCGVQDVL